MLSIHITLKSLTDCCLNFSHKILSSLHGSDHYRIFKDIQHTQEIGETSNRSRAEKKVLGFIVRVQFATLFNF